MNFGNLHIPYIEDFKSLLIMAIENAIYAKDDLLLDC